MTKKINVGDLMANPNYAPEEVIGMALGEIKLDGFLDAYRILWWAVDGSLRSTWESHAEGASCLAWKKRLDHHTASW